MVDGAVCWTEHHALAELVTDIYTRTQIILLFAATQNTGLYVPLLVVHLHIACSRLFSL